jgi:hypothetical protein
MTMDQVMAAEAVPVPALATAATVDADDAAALRRAVETLEGTTLATRINALIGRRIDFAAQLIPAAVMEVANKATMKALRVALKAAIRSLSGEKGTAAAKPRLHLAAAALSGAAGGAFGISALPLELPLSTTIMLRSIAEIARSEGEDLSNPETLLACLEVFALGGGAEHGPASESGYLATRSLLAKSVAEAARLMVQRGAVDESAPAIVRLLAQIAARFGLVVGQKTVTQAIPLIGAVTGAAINAAFTDHFQALARAHFTVRRLERRYGAAAIQALFAQYKAALRREEEERHAEAPDRIGHLRDH